MSNKKHSRLSLEKKFLPALHHTIKTVQSHRREVEIGKAMMESNFCRGVVNGEFIVTLDVSIFMTLIPASVCQVLQKQFDYWPTQKELETPITIPWRECKKLIHAYRTDGEQRLLYSFPMPTSCHGKQQTG